MSQETPESILIAQRKLEYPARPREKSSLLPWLLGVSLFFHAMGFYAFHVVYPQPQPFFARGASITVVQPDRDWSPRSQEWLRQEDPSLLTRFRSQKLMPLGTLPGFEPLWMTQSPQLQEPAPLDLLAQLRQQAPAYQPRDLLRPPPVTTPPREQERPAPRLSPGGSSRLTFTWLGDQAGRILHEPVDLPFRLPTVSSFQPATFTIGVDASGRVRHVLPQQSSNIEQVDELARRKLFDLRFQPLPGTPRLTWAVATFHWGANDFIPAEP
jgi:hypothetical protein